MRTSDKTHYSTPYGLLVQFWYRPQPVGNQKYTKPRKHHERRFRSYHDRDKAMKEWNR